MQAVIMAGGKGTRLFSLTNDEIPKPMVRLCNKPILEYQIEMLKRNGIYEILLVVGHKHEKIVEYFQEGTAFGVHIEYIIEEQPLGTAGVFYFLKDKIEEDFMLVFGDIILDIDVNRMIQFHQSKISKATLFVHPNGHPFDSDLVVLDDNAQIVGFDSKHNKREYYYNNCVNAGIYIISSELLGYIQEAKKVDLEKDILFNMVDRKESIFGYVSTEYVKDVGTPERLKKTEMDIKKGLVSKRNLSHKQKCIFIDRDGTLNKHKGLLCKHEELELEDCAIQALKEANDSEFLTIVITNQPVVARNLCSIEEVNYIHRKLETLLGNEGAYVDGIKFCPHHPDKGYPEENPVYKIACTCRKPKIGLIEQCMQEYNIDLGQSWFIGDTTIDVMTGINAEIRTILVKTGEAGNDKKYDVTANKVCKDILEAIRFIKEEV